jgi:hypothetical protein
MSSLASTLQSPRNQRRIMVVAALVLLAGIAAFAVARLGDHPEAKPLDRSADASVKDVSTVPKTVKLQPAARLAAQRFILTAVARKNLKEAYGLAGPQIKQGQTLKQWLTGNIAVVPYPVDDLKVTTMKIDYSYANEAAIEVALIPEKGASVKSTIFYMDLIKRHGKWLVNSWVPRSAPEVPLATG